MLHIGARHTRPKRRTGAAERLDGEKLALLHLGGVAALRPESRMPPPGCGNMALHITQQPNRYHARVCVREQASASAGVTKHAAARSKSSAARAHER